MATAKTVSKDMPGVGNNPEDGDTGSISKALGGELSIETGNLIGNEGKGKLSLIWQLNTGSKPEDPNALLKLLKRDVSELAEEIIIFKESLVQPEFQEITGLEYSKGIEIYKTAGSKDVNIRLILQDVSYMMDFLGISLADHIFVASLMNEKGESLIEKCARCHFVAGDCVFDIPGFILGTDLEDPSFVKKYISSKGAILLVLGLLTTKTTCFLKSKAELEKETLAEKNNNVNPMHSLSKEDFDIGLFLSDPVYAQLKNFWKNGKYCDGKIDVKLKGSVEIKSFPIHRNILAAQSKTMDDVLSTSGTITLENCSEETVIDLLDYFYSNQSLSKDMDFSRLMALMKLANELNVIGLESKCKSWFPEIKSKMKISEFVELYKLADESWDSIPLKHFCLDYFNGNKVELLGSDSDGKYKDFVEEFGIAEMLIDE